MANSRWIEIQVERTLYVDRGRETILCDRGSNSETILVRLSEESQAELRRVLGVDDGR